MRSLKFVLIGILFILLVVGLPVYFFTKSLFITKMVILSIVGFYLGFLVLVHWLKRIFTNRVMSVILDGISTMLIVVVSFPIIIIVRFFWLLLLRSFPEHRYKYSHYIISGMLFILGIKVKFEGKFCKSAKLFLFNHTTILIDVLLIAFSLPRLPYNIIAGINLIEDRDGIEGEVVYWLLGKIIKDFLITVDRKKMMSRVKAFKRMEEELVNGKIVSLSPEEGRLPKPEIDKGFVLKEKFVDGPFKLAFENNYIIQLAVLDWPVIWHGKDDDRFGIHPTTIKITFVTVNPETFSSFEDLKEHCYDVMKKKLRESKNVIRFIEECSKVRH